MDDAERAYYLRLKTLANNIETMNEELNNSIVDLAEHGAIFLKTIKVLNKAYMANLEAIARINELGTSD